MTGVEASGVEFILRFRDEASTQIGTAEQAYNSLVAAMQKVLQAEKSFSEGAIESMNRSAAAAKRAGGSALITPLTVDPSRMQLISQFEQISMTWFRDIGALYGKYLTQVRAAVTTTGLMRDVVVGLSEAAKEGSGGVDSLFRMARKFTSMKFDKDGSLGQFLAHLQDIVKVFADFYESSGEAAKGADQVASSIDGVSKAATASKPKLHSFLEALQKAFTPREATTAAQGVGQVERGVDKLGDSAQKASFHMLDVRDGIRKVGQEAGNKGGFLDGLKDKFKSLKGAIGDIATVGQLAFAALVGGKAAQAWSSLEDVAFRIKTQTGDISINTKQLVKDMADLALKNNVTQQGFAAVSEIVAKLGGNVNAVSTSTKVMIAQLSELTGAGPELVGSFAMKLREVGKLTDDELKHEMAVMWQLQKGAKIGAAEWMQIFDDMSDQTRQMAKSYEMTEKQIIQGLYPAIAQGLRATQDVYGDPEVMKMAIKSTLSWAGEEFQQINQLLASTGVSIQELQKDLISGNMEGFIGKLKQAVDFWDRSGAAGQTMMENFARNMNVSVEGLRSMSKITPDVLKNAGKNIDPASAMTQFQRDWQEFLTTFSKRWSVFQEQMQYWAQRLFPIIDKYILTPLESVSNLLKQIGTEGGDTLKDTVALVIGLTSAWMSMRIVVSIFSNISRALGITTGAVKANTAAVEMNATKVIMQKNALTGATTATWTFSTASDVATAKVGLMSRALGVAATAAKGFFYAWMAWEVGDFVGKVLLQIVPGLKQLDEFLTNWVAEHVPAFLDFFSFRWMKDGASSYAEQYKEYIKKLKEIQISQGEDAATKFRGLMANDQGFAEMSIDKFKDFMETQRQSLGGPKAAPSAADPKSMNSDPAAPAAKSPEVNTAPKPAPNTSSDERILVDPVTGKTSYKEPYDEEIANALGQSRPTQTVRDDIRDEKGGDSNNGVQIAELLRENNAHLKWIREYAADAASRMKNVTPRNTSFVQGL